MANGATIDVKYFARVAEVTGLRAERLPCPEGLSGEALIAQLRRHHPALAELRNLRLAVNQTHVPVSTVIAPGDEVAVFQPVTGG